MNAKPVGIEDWKWEDLKDQFEERHFDEMQDKILGLQKRVSEVLGEGRRVDLKTKLFQKNGKIEELHETIRCGLVGLCIYLRDSNNG